MRCYGWIIIKPKTYKNLLVSQAKYQVSWRICGTMCHSNKIYFFLVISVNSEVGRKNLNRLWPNDAIWQHGSGSTLDQVMACCSMAPSHYQCWLIISEVQPHSSESNFQRKTSVINHKSELENHLSKFSFKSPRGQWVKFNWLKNYSHCGYTNYCKHNYSDYQTANCGTNVEQQIRF